MRLVINDRISLPMTSMANGLQAPNSYVGTEADINPFLTITFPYSKNIYATLTELFENKIKIEKLEFQNDIGEVVFIINQYNLKFSYIQHYLDCTVNSIVTKWILEDKTEEN